MKKFGLAKQALALCHQNILERFAGSILGWAWIFIWPLAQLFIYMIIFGRLMGARLGVDNQVFAYGFYVASGLLAWTCFAGIMQRTARMFVDKRQIIRKVAVDLRVFPLAVVFEELLPFAAGWILLFAAGLLTGWRPAASLFVLALLALCCMLCLAFGLGLFLSCCAVFARDVTEAVPIALQMAFWFTPIVYLPSILPPWLENILWLNPMTVVVGILQNFFVLGGTMGVIPCMWLVFASLSALALGLYILSMWNRDIRDVL